MTTRAREEVGRQRMGYAYRVEYPLQGQPVQRTTYESEMPLEAGQWIAAGSTYLVVVRIIPPKRGDPPDSGLALCRLAMG